MWEQRQGTDINHRRAPVPGLARASQTTGENCRLVLYVGTGQTSAHLAGLLCMAGRGHGEFRE